MLIFDQQFPDMTVKSIEEQISTIRRATETALSSPEAALEFLQRAGIVGPDKKIAGKQNDNHNGPPKNVDELIIDDYRKDAYIRAKNRRGTASKYP